MKSSTLMYKLNNKSKIYIKDVTGLSFDSILEMNSTEIDIQIEKKTQRKIKSSPSVIFKTSGRGTPFINLWRFVGLDIIDKKLDSII